MTLEHRHHERCACGSGLSSFVEGRAARTFAFAGTERVYERARPFRIHHLALELDLNPKGRSIAGIAKLHVERVDASAKVIELDAVNFDVRDVAWVSVPRLSARAGAKLVWRKRDFVYDGEKLSVELPTDAAFGWLRVQYRAAPKRGLYFLEPDEHVPLRPRQIWSQCQDEDARYIFPCHDKPHVKQSMELAARVPAGWFLLSNGEAVSNAREQKTGLFRYRLDEPQPSYLFTLVAGEFDTIEDQADGVPLVYYVPKGRVADGKRTFGRTPEMMRHFGELLGVKYPWSRYSQIVVSDFIFGGMENTTATTMYEHILLDKKAGLDVTSDDLIAHELAHQWFGDYVTCRDWSHGWLNEGFATFMEHIDREKRLGRDEYLYGISGDMESYVGEANGHYKRPVVCQDYEAPIDIFDRHLYEKGGCILHLLRLELGDANFWSGVRLYLSRHARGIVETRDLMRAFEEVSGKSLERFFEQWLYRPGHPSVDVEIEYDKGSCTVRVKQTQAQPPNARDTNEAAPIFAFDLTLDIEIDGKVHREVRHVDQASHTFQIPMPKRPRYVAVDAELRVLGEVNVKAPRDMAQNQLREAKTAFARIRAARELRKTDDLVSTERLALALADDGEFWGTRAECADSLGHIRSRDTLSVLLKHVKTKHPKVRRAVVRALGHYRASASAEALKPLALADPSYLVQAEAARSLGATRQSGVLETLVDIIDRPSWADVVRMGAIDGLAKLRDERALPHVSTRTRYGVSTRGRRAAILALPKLSTDRKTRETLEELLDAEDPYVRADVARALGEVGDARARTALHRQLDRELDGRVRRRIREVLRDLGLAAKREPERLRDELETLRSEHAELKGRVAKVEKVTRVRSRKPKTGRA